MNLNKEEIMKILDPSIAYLLEMPKYKLISTGYDKNTNELLVEYVLKGHYCSEGVVMTDELWDKYYDMLETYLNDIPKEYYDISQGIDYTNNYIINGICIVAFRFIIKVNFL